MVDVIPGDTVRVSFTLKNTGSPVGGVTPDDFSMDVIFINAGQTYVFSNFVLSGAMATNQSKSFSVDVVVPGNALIEDYNLEIQALDPNSVIAATGLVPNAVTVLGAYSASITSISVIKI